MSLSLKGKDTTYHAGYKTNARGENKGIGLYTDNHKTGDLNDIAYLWPENNQDMLIIDLDELKKQNIRVALKSRDTISDVVNFRAQLVKRRKDNE